MSSYRKKRHSSANKAKKSVVPATSSKNTTPTKRRISKVDSVDKEDDNTTLLFPSTPASKKKKLSKKQMDHIMHSDSAGDNNNNDPAAPPSAAADEPPQEQQETATNLSDKQVSVNVTSGGNDGEDHSASNQQLVASDGMEDSNVDVEDMEKESDQFLMKDGVKQMDNSVYQKGKNKDMVITSDQLGVGAVIHQVDVSGNHCLLDTEKYGTIYVAFTSEQVAENMSGGDYYQIRDEIEGAYKKQVGGHYNLETVEPGNVFNSNEFVDLINQQTNPMKRASLVIHLLCNSHENVIDNYKVIYNIRSEKKKKSKRIGSLMAAGGAWG